ncbi:unnamed protein product [Fraxinus pennsylvanica]|uniref:Uridine kinase n=1 Tax=Fraxinus pennsylvanica TaxID=56036 RepID=A0AAD1Z8M2_9LAMI|nr:unnamed protein product [Fraxinus pennsylvanica]
MESSDDNHFSVQSNGGSELKQPFIIGVAGGTASGKTTVCNMIISQLHDQRVILVNQDSFYHSLTDEQLQKVHEYNFDHPDAFDTELLLSCMETLSHGRAVSIPNYDFKRHQKIDHSRMVNPADVIILEGILVLHDSRVRDLMNMKIFVDTDSDVRLARRIKRDTVERGRNIEYVLDQYAKYVKPSFEEFILPSMKHADVIIPRGADNDVAIDLIVQHICTKLGQHNLCKIYPNVFVIYSTFQVVEHGLGHLPFTEKQIITPTGSVYSGVVFCRRLCGVSVIRSGESMENALRACCKGIKIGKILIHREGKDGRQCCQVYLIEYPQMLPFSTLCGTKVYLTKYPTNSLTNVAILNPFSSFRISHATKLLQLIYEKLPSDIASRHVLLLDPVLASGHSAVEAISVLLSKGVVESNIIFLNLISAPEGIHAVCKKFPRLKIVTSEIDVSLNKDLRVIPGMGEFGDRYFGTGV